MIPRFTLFTLILLSLIACSAEQSEVLSFQPQAEQERRYQFVATSQIMARDGHDGEHKERIQQTEMTSYRVTQLNAESVQLRVKPDYLHAQADSGMVFGSILGATFGEDRAQLDLLAAGTEIQVARNDGRLLQPARGRYLNARVVLMGTLNRIQEVLAQPGIASGMPLQVGATRSFKEAADKGVPGFTLKVRSVNEDKVLFTIESDSGEAQIYGRMLVERETGWLSRAGVVVKSDFKDDDYKGDIRTTISITAADWPYAELLEYSGLNDIEIDFSPLAENLDHLSMATEEQVFAESEGSLKPDGGRFTLEYSHPLDEAEEAGQFRFTQIQALDEQGEPLDLEFQALRPYSYADGNGQVITTGEVFPIGWQDMETKLEQVHSLQVQVLWLPQQLRLVPITVPEQGVSELEHGDARARLQATDNPREFDLYMYPTAHQLFGIQVYGGAESGVLYDLPIEDGADWLNDKEREMLNVIQHGEYPVRTRLRFRDQAPEQLKLVKYDIEQEPKAKQLVRFQVN